MTGQILGYKRVSSILQNTERQLDGVTVDQMFEDKLSGKDTNRPALQAMLKHARKGDTVCCHSLDRLGRNIDDLREIVKSLVAKGVTVKFMAEGLTFSADSSNIFSELMLNMLSSFASFERALSKERQREGVQLAKAKGVYKGRKQEMTAETLETIKVRIEAGEAKAAICKDLKISRDTLYRYFPVK
jgi:DNA invertase Pin-like site-specific DNA recombinase